MVVIVFIPLTNYVIFFKIHDSDECLMKLFFVVILSFLNIPFLIIGSEISFVINVWSLFYWPLQEKIVYLYFKIFDLLKKII